MSPLGHCGGEISNLLKPNKAMSFSPEGFETSLFQMTNSLSELNFNNNGTYCTENAIFNVSNCYYGHCLAMRWALLHVYPAVTKQQTMHD
jgi:hypothetical protein